MTDAYGQTVAYLGRKTGMGEARTEEEPKVHDLAVAFFLYNHAEHKLQKRRYLKVDDEGRTWEIDFFEGHLKGLVLAEYESTNPIGLVTPPPWLEDAVDVTETVNNVLLAELATEISRGNDLQMPLADLLTLRVPRVVLTGGPCSGKSGLCRLVTDTLPDVHVVPEVASIIFGQVGARPPTHEFWRRQFNRDLTAVQLAFEGLADVHCKNAGKSKLLLDRGCVDNAAYDPQGLLGFSQSLGYPVEHLYRRYDMVICLGTPNEAVYRANRANNPARTETYPEACDRGDRTRQVWSGHPNFHFVPNQGSWEETVSQVLGLLAAA